MLQVATGLLIMEVKDALGLPKWSSDEQNFAVKRTLSSTLWVWTEVQIFNLSSRNVTYTVPSGMTEFTWAPNSRYAACQPDDHEWQLTKVCIIDTHCRDAHVSILHKLVVGHGYRHISFSPDSSMVAIRPGFEGSDQGYGDIHIHSVSHGGTLSTLSDVCKGYVAWHPSCAYITAFTFRGSEFAIYSIHDGCEVCKVDCQEELFSIGGWDPTGRRLALGTGMEEQDLEHCIPNTMQLMLFDFGIEVADHDHDHEIPS